MMLNVEKLFTYLFLLIPLFLITGPAIPDITISVGVLFGIFYIVLLQNYRMLYESNFFIISILFWFSLIFISLFAYKKIDSFQDSIIYIRLLLIPIFCYFIFFRDSRIFKYSLLLILILIIFVCVDTIYQFINYTSRDGFGEDILGFKSNWYGRLTGPFGDELIPGSYVSKFGLFGFAFLISSKRFQNKTIIQSIYLSLILFVSYVSGERMSFATFSLGLLVLFIFLNDFRKSIFLSIIIGVSLILITLYLHPFYNDYTVIESTQFHQGQKIEKIFLFFDLDDID